MKPMVLPFQFASDLDRPLGKELYSFLSICPRTGPEQALGLFDLEILEPFILQGNHFLRLDRIGLSSGLPLSSHAPER